MIDLLGRLMISRELRAISVSKWRVVVPFLLPKGMICSTMELLWLRTLIVMYMVPTATMVHWFTVQVLVFANHLPSDQSTSMHKTLASALNAANGP